MSDPWARPDEPNGPRPNLDDVIEIELDGPGRSTNKAVSGDPGSQGGRSGRGRFVALAIIALAAVGGAIAAAVSSGDDDEGAASSSTVDPELMASRITAPPTLAPILEPLAPAADAAADAPACSQPNWPDCNTWDSSDESPAPAAGDDSVTAQGVEPIDLLAVAVSGLALPEYAAVGPGIDNPNFELTDRALEIDGSVLTTMSVTSDATTADELTILYDVTSGRARIWSPDDPFEAVVDLANDALYATADGSTWERLEATEAFEQFGVSPVEYVEALALGPVRPETIDMVTPGQYAELPDGELVREYLVEVRAQRLPEWALLYVPGAEGDPPSRLLEFLVYVTAEGEVREMVGLNSTGGFNAVFTSHRRIVGNPMSIELPNPDAIVSGDATGDAVDVATTLGPVGASAAPLSPDTP